jgi:hypothetical protein
LPKNFHTAGGFTTNGTGDITVQAVGLASIEGVVAMQQSNSQLFMTWVSGAPAGYMWLRTWYAQSGGATPLVNTFMVCAIWAWGT